jgi:hypothetical protein
MFDEPEMAGSGSRIVAGVPRVYNVDEHVGTLMTATVHTGCDDGRVGKATLNLRARILHDRFLLSPCSDRLGLDPLGQVIFQIWWNPEW